MCSLVHMKNSNYIIKSYKQKKSLSSTTTTFLVPEAGLEPAQPQWPKDFKSFVSTIPPSGQKCLVNSSEKRDSNPRPQPWQGCALPTELFSHFVDRMCYPFFADAKLCIFIYSTMTFMKKILLTLIDCYTVYCVG